jgi:hypothetical protein
MPRLIVFSQARWSGKIGGENCLRGPGPHKRTRCRRAHANTASNNDPTRRGFCRLTLHLPSSTRAGAPTGRVTGGSKDGVMPQREVRAKARLFSPGVSRLILTSPCLVLSTRRLGRTPYFRNWKPRPAGRQTARYQGSQLNSFLPKFRYRGADRDRTRLWAPSLPGADSVRTTCCISLCG